jgi:hypothetical protein
MPLNAARVATALVGLTLPFALVSPAAAAPGGADRASGSATFYEHAGHGAPSASFGGAHMQCVNLPLAWQKKISSFTTGAATVILYSQPNCWQDGPWQEYRGSTSNVGERMNDKTISFRISG